jgi:3-oxoacyl-[acyl-carrier-protein] synthase II
MNRRIVVTGIGTVTSIGVGRERFWTNLLHGRSGVTPVQSFDTAEYSVHNGAEVREFNAKDFVRNLNLNQLGRASQFAVAAARLALADAGSNENSLDPSRVGVAMGTTSGEPGEIERFDDRYVRNEIDKSGRDFLSRYPCNLLAANVAREFGFEGVNLVIPTACAAGNYAIAYAFDVLRAGRAEVMFAGGADSFSRITYSGFARLGAVAPEICQPFDRNRRGMIPGEGAAVLVLETLDAAIKRDARVYAEVAGYGLSCDGYHMTGGAPDGAGAAKAMVLAIKDSGVQPEEVNYISAHGTGTPTNDLLETIAVKRVFQENAYRIPISSIKSMLGHTMGAASAIEAAVCALAVSNNQIPPTINFTTPDPQCDLDYVPNHARAHEVNVAMSNAYAFGGNNASLVIRRCEAGA